MSTFDDASLVMIPSAYKPSKIYSVKPTDGTGDLVFTRALDTATRVGPDGLIEKVRTNLALYSEDFTNAYWLKTSATITGDTIANPIDGALTADTYTPTNVSALTRIRSGFISLASVGMSIFVKSNGYTKVGLREDVTTGNYATYDLSSGTILDSSGVVSPTINELANGWYRISLGVTASPSLGMGVWILDPTYTTGPFSASNWTADGTSGIYVFGAQIEGGDIATPYIPTTTAAVSVGMLANVPRLDYLGGGCPKLLLEPQRTNSIAPSEDFTAVAFSKLASGTGVIPVVTANQGTAPTGFANADRIDLNIGAGTTASDVSRILFSTLTAPVAGSVYLKSFDGVSTYNMFFRVANTTIAIVVTGEWQRFSAVELSSGSNLQFGLQGNLATSASASVLAWGAQLEAGSYATSYIPTLGAAVTRSADEASKTGISALIGQTEGTLFAELDDIKDIDSPVVTIDDNTNNNRIVIVNESVTGNWGIFRVAAGVGVAVYGTTSGTSGKFALAYSAAGYVLYRNGVQVAALTNTIPSSLSAIRLNGRATNDLYGAKGISQALLFKTRLTNAQLEELTA